MAEKSDLSCKFDLAKKEAVILKGDIPLVVGTGMEDVAKSFLNRAFGARAGMDFEGQATVSGANAAGTGDFTVSTVDGAGNVVCSVPSIGLKNVPGAKR